MAQWKACRIVSKQVWTDDLFSLRFDTPVLTFNAGQFVRVALDINGERVARPYSLVNSPGQPEAEIYFNTVPGGPLSPALAALKPGDEIWVSAGANGFLTLDEVPSCEVLWLFATGTGIGPFVSMLGTETPWLRFREIVLVHSVRRAAELGYRVLLQGLAQAHPGQFHYQATVTRERVPGALAGRIPALLTDGSLEAAVGEELNAENSHVMLCGSAAMIADTTSLLEQRGLRRHRRREPGHITTEKYH